MPVSRYLIFLLVCFCSVTQTAAEIHVYAAASLTDAVQEIARSWEAASGHTIRFNFAGSNILARQIIEGAPADLFLSADEEKMNDLQNRGLIETATRCSRLSNTLVIAVPRDGTPVIRKAGDLASPRFDRIALADPASVPAGIYAKQYLQKIGIWKSISGRIVPTENVRGTVAAVESGNVDAGIVYRTDALDSRRIRVAVSIGQNDGPAISYPFAVLKNSAHPRNAKRFLDYLLSPDGLRIFKRRGFLIKPPC